MPGFDETGPRGEGPRTGGGFGRCSDAANSEDTSATKDDAPRGRGRGGRPWGGGRGRGSGGGRGGRFGQGRSRRRRRTGAGGEFGPFEPASDSVLERIVEQLRAVVDQLALRVTELERGEEK